MVQIAIDKRDSKLVNQNSCFRGAVIGTVRDMFMIVNILFKRLLDFIKSFDSSSFLQSF